MRSALLLLLVLGGCADLPRVTYYGAMYRSPLHIPKGYACVAPEWVQQAQMAELCRDPKAMACAIERNGYTTIYAVKPFGWTDSYRLEALGHELVHALGGEHE